MFVFVMFVMTRIRHVGNDLAAGAAFLMAVAVTAWQLFDLPATYLLQAVALYALLAALVARSVPAIEQGRGLGAANRVTLGRAALLLPVTALALHADALGDPVYWWIIVVSTIGMVLDGADGWMARRTSTATAFGARFDMELDAFLLLALSILVWRRGQTGPWVVLIGGLRYLFVAAGWIWPILQAALPASRRRKALCVVQGVVLLVCLGPITPAIVASVGAMGALSLLVYSFTIDVWWLVRNGRG